MKKKTVKIPIYNGSLTFYKTDNLQEVFDKHDLKGDAKKFAGVAFRDPAPSGYSRYFIAITPEASVGAMVHEAKHIVNKIFFDRGVELDLLNDEPECYLLQWIFNQLHKFVK